MHPTRLAALAFTSSLLLACSSTDKRDPDSVAAAEPETSGSAAADSTDAVKDSIPMEITVTVTPGPKLKRSLAATPGSTFDGGPFTSRSKGTQCEHFPDAVAGTAASPEWQLHWTSPDDRVELQGIQLAIGRTTNNTTNEMEALIVAGKTRIGGMDGPVTNQISTIPGSIIKGHGTAKAERVGEGVRFEIEGLSAESTTVKAVIRCDKLGSIS